MTRLNPIKIFLAFVCVLLFSSGTPAQSASDTAKAGGLLRKAVSLKDSVEITAMLYADSAVKLGIKSRFYPVVVDGLLLKGRMHMDENRLSMAFDEFQRANDYSLLSGDSLRLSKCLNSMGDVYKQLHMPREAIDYIEQSVNLAQRIGDLPALTTYLNKLGHVYMDWGESTNDHSFFDKALSYYQRALKVNEETGNQRLLCTSYVNLANSFLVRMKHGADSSNASHTVRFSKMGIDIAERNHLRNEVALNTLNIGEAFLLNKEYDKAIFYFNRSFEIYRELKTVLWEAATLRDLALAYSGKGEIDKAIHLTEDANKLIIEYSHVEQFDNYRLLAALYEQKGDFKRSLAAYKKYKELEDIENNVRNTIEIERTHIERDILEKDSRILQLQKEMLLIKKEQSTRTILNYVMAAFVFLALVVLIMLYFRGRILRRAKEVSDKAREMQEQFVANTSHELRTPLNGIMGMAEQLMRTTPDQRQLEYINVIRTSSNNLLRMINDLLDLSKINAGKMDFEEKNFRLKEFLDQLELQVRGGLGDKKIQLNFTSGENLPEIISGDAMRLQQILLNLLENAIKFTREGQVSLHVLVAEQKKNSVSLKFEVADSGPGIPREKFGQIFQNFVQLENAGKRIHGGNGLGLAITKFLTESQGGRISVSSETGKGSVFTVRLPFRTDNPEPVESMVPPSSNNINCDLELCKILVVEDNRINQRVIESTLEKWNCEYVIVDAAVKAFEELTAQKFDLILMDIELPSISGIEATRYIRQKFTNENKNIPIIALTAYVMDTEREKCLEAGMNDLVTKPFDPALLYAKISQVLGRKVEISTKRAPAIVTDGFSFEELEKKYDGDPEGLLELLNLFISELPLYCAEIEEATRTGNLDHTKKVLHKIKSPSGLFGRSKLLLLIEEMEHKIHSGFSEETATISAGILRHLHLLEEEIKTFIKKTRTF